MREILVYLGELIRWLPGATYASLLSLASEVRFATFLYDLAFYVACICLAIDTYRLSVQLARQSISTTWRRIRNWDGYRRFWTRDAIWIHWLIFYTLGFLGCIIFVARVPGAGAALTSERTDMKPRPPHLKFTPKPLACTDVILLTSLGSFLQSEAEFYSTETTPRFVLLGCFREGKEEWEYNENYHCEERDELCQHLREEHTPKLKLSACENSTAWMTSRLTL